MNLYTAILVSFLSGGCVDEVVDNWADYQWYEYDVYFLQCHTLTVIHDINGEGVWKIIRKTILM